MKHGLQFLLYKPQKMETIEINGTLFSITYYSNNWIFMVARWDGEEFIVPYTRNTFKTRKGALKRCEELAK